MLATRQPMARPPQWRLGVRGAKRIDCSSRRRKPLAFVMQKRNQQLMGKRQNRIAATAPSTILACIWTATGWPGGTKEHPAPHSHVPGAAPVQKAGFFSVFGPLYLT